MRTMACYCIILTSTSQQGWYGWLEARQVGQSDKDMTIRDYEM